MTKRKTFDQECCDGRLFLESLTLKKKAVDGDRFKYRSTGGYSASGGRLLYVHRGWN